MAESKKLWAKIREDRHKNNDLFMDWIEATHDCPRCGPLARAMHPKIWLNDGAIHEHTAQKLYPEPKCE